MVAVKLKGVAKVTARGRKYYYAWRGGPRLKGEPGSPEFLASLNEAHQDLRAPDDTRFRSVVYGTRRAKTGATSPRSTRRHWDPWLDRIAEYFGELRVAQFDRPEKIRPVIRKWRSQYAATPRTADYGMQVLSRVLSYAVDPSARLGSNPCDGIKQLYTADRSEMIWTDADIAQLKAICSAEIAWAVDLAAHTGLRLGDLLRLSWSHVGDDAIRLARARASTAVRPSSRSTTRCAPYSPASQSGRPRS